MNRGQTRWTEESTARLTELWAEEKLSASEIATALGPQFTRNAVIGKAVRLDLGSHAHLRSDPTVQRRAHGSVKRERLALAPVPVVEPEPIGPVASSAGAGVCQYIKADPSCDPDWQMCGHPGYPWCPYHRSIVFTAAMPNKMAASSSPEQPSDIPLSRLMGRR